jgi:hypothetical protein
MNTLTAIKCNHFFCTLGGKSKDAVAKVTVIHTHAKTGAPVMNVTYCCESDLFAMKTLVGDSPNATIEMI